MPSMLRVTIMPKDTQVLLRISGEKAYVKTALMVLGSKILQNTLV